MSEVLHIIHLEDVQSDADIVKREMTKSGIKFKWIHVSSKNDFHKALKEFSPDIILSDHTLPGFTSIQAFKMLKDEEVNIPFILVTATVSEEFAVDMIKEGIADYLLKDRLQRLPNAVLSALEKWKSKREKKAHVAEIIRSENRFRSLIETSHDMLMLFDETGKIEYMSKAAKEAFGIASENDYPGNALGIIHPEDLKNGEVLLARAFKNPGLPFYDVFRNLKKDGTDRWVEGTLTNQLHVDGVNAFVFSLRDITERKQAEDAIRKSEANLNAIIENSDVSIYSLDREFRYITFNTLLKNSLKGIYGLDVRIGDNVFNFLEKLDASEAREWKDTYTKALSGKSLRFEKEFKGPGFYSCVRFFINPIWENKNVIGLSCLAEDITEQKKAEESLRQSEEQYRNIVETAQEGIWITDANHQTNFVNKKMGGILECTVEEMMAVPMFHFMDDEGKRIAAQGLELNKSGANETLEFKFITKTGKTVWTNLATSPLLNSKGQYVGALAMVTDITKKKLSQESLQKSEANIRNIFDNTNVAYVLLDPDLHIISFNEVAVILYQKELGKALEQGRNLLDYFTGQRRTDLENRYQYTLQGERVSYEIYSTSIEGTINWFNVQLSPVFDSTQKILGMVIAVTDITERKESELQRDKITSDLVQRNKDLEQFAYIVSHNLRAPVANILGIAKVLEFPDLNKEERTEIEQGISISAQKLDEVIIDLNHILQVKRDVSEKKEMVRFSAIVSDINASIADFIKRENAKIVVDFHEIDEYRTLKSYLYSIFYNLISNSIKYRMKDINPVIHIHSLLKKDTIELLFSDNGIGIDLARHKDKIFGLYKRFHSIESEGKGMGLFMVKTQVETLGGKISVDSTIGKGTEFKIELEFNV